VLVLAGPLWSATPVPPRELAGPGVLLAGQGEWLWVVSLERDGSSSGTARLVARQVGGDWQKPQARQMSRVLVAGMCGDRLHVLLPGNRHYEYSPDGGDSLRNSVPADFTPIALAGSEDQLVALGLRLTATTQPASSPAGRPKWAGPRRSLQVLRQARGQAWTELPPLPEELWHDREATAASVTMHLGRPVVLALVADRLLQAEWTDDSDGKGGKWQGCSVRLPSSQPDLADVQVLSINKKIWLVGWPIGQGTPFLARLERRGGGNGGDFGMTAEQPRPLNLDPALKLATRYRQWDLAACGDRVVIVRSDPKSGKLQLTRVDPSSGATEGAWQPVEGLDAGPDWLTALLHSNVLVMAMFGAATLGVMFRRPNAIVRLPVHVEPAKLRYRLLAFVVDFLPCSMIAQMIVYGANPAAYNRDLSVLNSGEMSATAFTAAALTLGVFAAYSMVAELLFATTLGKRLMKLGVYSVQGVRPGAVQIIIRNVLKPVEIFLFPLLLIMFRPLRQRLGDLLGGTIVVMPRQQPLPPWTRLSDNSHDQDDPPASPS
jgi:uncharacterized RDD family membrane protein YckC